MAGRRLGSPPRGAWRSTLPGMEFAEAFSPTRAISHGVEGIRRAPGALLVGGFFMWVTSGGCGNSSSASDLGEVAKDQSPEVSAAILLVVLGVLAVVVVLSFFVFLFRSFLHTGYLRLHREVLRTGEDNFSVLVSGGDAFGRMAAWKLLSGFIGFGTMIVAAIPGGVLMGVGVAQDSGPALIGAGLVLLVLCMVPVSIYVSLGLALGAHAVALEGLGAMDALDRSWELARGNRLTLFVFFLVTGLFSLLGAIACCIGMFVTRTMADVGTTEAFLLATNPEVREWVIPKMP